MQNLEEQQKVETLQLTNEELLEPGRTKADNNQLVLRSLTGLAVLCVAVSGASILDGFEGAIEFAKMVFAPVSMIVAGLLVFIKN